MPRPSRCAVVVAVLASSLGAAATAKAQSAIASCESATLGQWKFLDGSEFPGAKGSLISAPGHSGTCAHLAYDFSAGGKYVGTTLVLSAPVQASAVSLWLKSPLGVTALLQLEDASGQTLEYQLSRPLEASSDESMWFRVVVDVAAPSQYFNGKNDGIPHPPFSRIAMLAQAESGTTGWVDFDEITAIDAFRATLEPSALLLMAAPHGATDLASRLAVNLHGIQDERALDIAHDAGFSAVRVDLVWASVERALGVYDFSQFDALVSALAARGMRLHLIVDYTNDLYPALDSAQFQTTTVPAFAAVASAFARHFAGRDVSYEIWNEPNNEQFWPASSGPSRYAVLCSAAAVALHQGDPSAKVSIGGLAGFDYDFLTTILSDGAGKGADAVSVHPYRRDGAESVGYDLLRLRSLVSDHASPAPVIWSTEWGYSSTWEGDGHGAAERARQAQLVAREALSAWAVGLPLIVIYNLRDDGTDATNIEHNFGLIQSDYTEKPALVAVRTLSRLARGRAFAGLLDTGFSKLHAMKYDGASDSVVALWSEYKGRPITVELPTSASAVSFLGKPAR
ncbi:MAG TPA: cellulase family glycosylhydrolase [Polyangiaceae bacterium]|nr:cellulase family glycosylhydrolase [Polyangiaceae bacterium]